MKCLDFAKPIERARSIAYAEISRSVASLYLEYSIGNTILSGTHSFIDNRDDSSKIDTIAYRTVAPLSSYDSGTRR